GPCSLFPLSGHRRFRGRAVLCSVDSTYAPPLLFYLSLIVIAQLGTVMSTVLSSVSPSPDYCGEEPPEEADDCDHRPHEGVCVELSHGPWCRPCPSDRSKLHVAHGVLLW